MKKNTLEPIKERNIILLINEEYSRAKIILKPLLNGINRSFIKFKWIKREVAIGGKCYCSEKLIALNKKYRDIKEGDWNENNMRLTIRHEIVHLVDKGHGGRFLSLLKEIEGHRCVGHPVYEGKKKTIKVINNNYECGE